MVNDTSVRPRLTPKGERTRARIVEKAAALIHERGVAATTLEDVKVAAEVSGSQLYHYFPDKNELVQAVIDYQADTIVNNQGRLLRSANGVEAWRKMVIAEAKRTQAKGGCPLGSLGGQLAECDPEGSSAHRGRVRSVGCRHQRWTAIPTCRWEAPVRHRPGRPRHYSARHAPRRASTRPGATEYPPVRNCGRYPPRSCHHQMSSGRVHSKPSPRSAHAFGSSSCASRPATYKSIPAPALTRTGFRNPRRPWRARRYGAGGVRPSRRRRGLTYFMNPPQVDDAGLRQDPANGTSKPIAFCQSGFVPGRVRDSRTVFVQ